MRLEHELPRLLREVGIATAEQAEVLAEKLADLLADSDGWAEPNRDLVRESIRT